MLHARNWDSHLRKGGFLILTVYYCLPALQPQSTMSVAPCKRQHFGGKIYVQMSHVYAEEFGADAFALQPKQTQMGETFPAALCYEKWGEPPCLRVESLLPKPLP